MFTPISFCKYLLFAIRNMTANEQIRLKRAFPEVRKIKKCQTGILVNTFVLYQLVGNRWGSAGILFPNWYIEGVTMVLWV